MYLAVRKDVLLKLKLSKKMIARLMCAAAIIPSFGVVSASPAYMGMNALSQNISIGGSFQHNGDVTITDNSSAVGNGSSSFGLLKTKGSKPSIANLDGLGNGYSHAESKFLSDVDTAFQVANGRRSPYGSVGCAETVTYAGSYYSPALKEAFDEGIASVPGLLSDLSAKGYCVEPFNGYANKGDLLVYGDDDHVVIADGHGGCFGNSSSRLQAMHYPNAAYAWGNGELPSKIVRMSGWES